MSEWHDCKTMFSNGTEFEFFMDSQCSDCVRYRNDHCRILNRCYEAMFDKAKFPFGDLLDHEKYANKKCKHRTLEPLKRKRNVRQIEGQMSFGDYDDVGIYNQFDNMTGSINL